MNTKLELVPEPLISFGELLKIKREKLGFSLVEAIKKSGITQMPFYERGKSYPTKKSMLKCIGFYRLTEADLALCKPWVLDDNKPQVALATSRIKRFTIEDILLQIKDITKKVESMEEHGLLAKKLRLDALDGLNSAQAQLENVLIIDKII